MTPELPTFEILLVFWEVKGVKSYIFRMCAQMMFSHRGQDRKYRRLDARILLFSEDHVFLNLELQNVAFLHIRTVVRLF